MSDFGEVCTGDCDLTAVANVSEFATAVFRKSRLFLNDEAEDLKSGAAKTNKILMIHLFDQTHNTHTLIM
jgi:hypothetical protein